MTTTPLPGNVTHGIVQGRLLRVVQDTVFDEDRAPKGVPITDAKVTLTAAVAYVRVPAADPPLILWVDKPYECTTDAYGLLLGPDGQPDLELVASDGEYLFPSGWTYLVRVEAAGMKPIEWNIVVPAGTVVDLATAIPVPANPGVEVARWVEATEIANAAVTRVLELRDEVADLASQVQPVKGDKGDDGPASTVPGPPGPSSTLSVGTVTTGAAGSSAAASVTGDSPDQRLNLTIPRGATGSTGPAGQITSVTATALAAAEAPTVTAGGTATARTFAFGIPVGAKGEDSTVPGPPGTTTWAGITDKPSTFTPAGHSHVAADLPTASSTGQGVIQTASNSLVQAGTNASQAVTPASLASRTATDTRTGLVELATDTEAQTGTDTARAVTPANLTARTATEARTGLVELATAAEVAAGTDTARAVTPAGLGSVLDARVGPASPIAVVIGNSHSAPDTAMWHSEVGAAMGWEIKNYAISGTGFIAGSTAQRYSGQVTSASSGLTTAEKARVRVVFLADASNDIRAASTAAAIKTAFESLVASIKTTFPNARIITIPAFWSSVTGSTNETTANQERLAATIQALRDAAAYAAVEYVDWSWTWHLGRADLMQSDQLHYVPAGKTLIAGWVLAYLRGSSTRSDQPWTLPTNQSGVANDGGTTGYGPLRASREGNTGKLVGRFWNNVVLSGTFTTLPEGMRPPTDVLVDLMLTGSWTRYTVVISRTGAVAPLTGSLPTPSSGQGYIANATFPTL